MSVQLQPITNDCSEQELRERIRINFQVLLDAYSKGMSSIVFTGKTGKSGNAGIRGSSVLVVTRTSLATANSIISTGILPAFDNNDKNAMAIAMTTFVNGNATIAAMFENLSFVQTTKDLLEYDIIVSENGYVFQVVKTDNDTWQIIALPIDLLTVIDVDSEINSIVVELTKNVAQPFKTLGLYKSQTERGIVYSLPYGSRISADDDENDFIDWNVIADESASTGLFQYLSTGVASTDVDPDAGSVLFCGSKDECNDVFETIKSTLDTNGGVDGVPKQGASWPRLIIPIMRNAVSTNNKPYGICFFTQDVPAQTTDANANITSAWTKQHANITYQDGVLRFEVQNDNYNANWLNRDDNRGCFIFSRNVVEFFAKEGLKVYGSLFVADAIVLGSISSYESASDTCLGLVETENGYEIMKQPFQNTFDIVPLGMIAMFPTNDQNDLGANWHECDGTSIDSLTTMKKTELRRLFGDNLPDMRDCFVQGARTVSGQQPAGTIGPKQTASDNLLTISAANLPRHKHELGTLNIRLAGLHSHQITDLPLRVSGTTNNPDVDTITNMSTTTTDNTSTKHTHTFETYTGTQAHSYDNPYANSASQKSADGTHVHSYQKASTVGKGRYAGSTNTVVDLNYDNVSTFGTSSHQHRVAGTTNENTINTTHSHSMTHTHSYPHTHTFSVEANASGNTDVATNHTHVIDGEIGDVVGVQNTPIDNRPKTYGLYYVVRIS